MQRLRRLIARAYTFDHPHEALVGSKRMLRRTMYALVAWLALSLMLRLTVAREGVSPEAFLIVSFVHATAAMCFTALVTALAIRAVLARHHRNEGESWN